MEEIIQQILLKLSQREKRVYSVRQSQLATGLDPQIYSLHARLHLQQPDLAFMNSLSHCDRHHPAVATVLDAWSYGVELHISLQSNLLSALSVLALSKLPLTLSDHQGVPVYLHTGRLMAYADVVLLSDCWLVTAQGALITTLAQEALTKQRIRLIRQE